jgi:DNA-binding response OmpR family regulator
MNKKKILIVDDDPDVRLGLHVRLKANQYETFVASDAMMAISEARKIQPDLVILDLGLPAGGGLSVLERMRANTYLATIPIIVVSAKDPAVNREESLKHGARAFLQKPVKKEALLAAIQNLLEHDSPRIS